MWDWITGLFGQDTEKGGIGGYNMAGSSDTGNDGGFFQKLLGLSDQEYKDLLENAAAKDAATGGFQLNGSSSNLPAGHAVSGLLANAKIPKEGGKKRNLPTTITGLLGRDIGLGGW